jgi:hypothetical protein
VKPVLKWGLIAAGYAAAILIAAAAVAIRVASTNGPDAQASGGMHAFGDAVVFVAVFGVAALVPTGAALIFLRPYRPFWVALSIFSLGVAATGISAAVLFAAGRHAEPSLLATLAALSVLRILVAPSLAFAFLVSALLSPYRLPRFALGGATLMEMAVSAYGALAWFLPLLSNKP